MDDLLNDLMGGASKALDLDIDLSEKTEAERARLERALEERAEVREIVEVAEGLQERHTEQLRAARGRVRIDPEADGEAQIEEAKRHLQEVNAALAKRREELVQAEKTVRVAREALRKAQQEARQELREQALELRAGLVRQITEALNAAQQANLELWMLAGLRKPAGIQMQMPIERDLLPSGLSGSTSLLQRYRSALDRAGIDHDLQTGDGINRFERDRLNREIRAWAEQARIKPDAEDVPA